MVAQVHDTLFVERRKHYIPEITILADADAVFFIHSGEFSAKLLISRILYRAIFVLFGNLDIL